MNLSQEGYKLYWRKTVAHLCSNKDVVIFHNCFRYFVQPMYILLVENCWSIAETSSDCCVRVTERFVQKVQIIYFVSLILLCKYPVFQIIILRYTGIYIYILPFAFTVGLCIYMCIYIYILPHELRITAGQHDKSRRNWKPVFINFHDRTK